MHRTSILFAAIGVVNGVAACDTCNAWGGKGGQIPINNGGVCLPGMSGGYNWQFGSGWSGSGTTDNGWSGSLSWYGGNSFSGFQCGTAGGKGKRGTDLLGKRTFGTNRCATGHISDRPAISCGKDSSQQFAINNCEISSNQDSHFELCHQIPGQSKECIQQVYVKQGQTVTVTNSQCGGATRVSFRPHSTFTATQSCSLSLHSIGFSCTTSTTKVTSSTFTPSSFVTTSSATTKSTQSTTAKTTSSVMTTKSTQMTTIMTTSSAMTTKSTQMTTSKTTSSAMTTQSSAATTSSFSTSTAAFNTSSRMTSSSLTVPYGNTTISTMQSSIPSSNILTTSSAITSYFTNGTTIPITTASTDVGTPSSAMTPSTVTTPVPPTTPVPGVCHDNQIVQGCLAAWIPITKPMCKDNTDSDCYCKQRDYIEHVQGCFTAWGTDKSETCAANDCLLSICHKYVASHPYFITGQPPQCAKPPPPPPGPSTISTLEIVSTSRTTCPAGETITHGGSTTVLTASTVITSVITSKVTTGSSTAAGITSSPPSPVIKTIYSTTEIVITSCASSVTNCPAEAMTVVTATSLVPAGVTTSTPSTAAGITGVPMTPGPMSTISFSTVVTVPATYSTGVLSGGPIPGSSTAVTVSTTIQVPIVGFTPGPDGSPVLAGPSAAAADTTAQSSTAAFAEATPDAYGSDPGASVVAAETAGSPSSGAAYTSVAGFQGAAPKTSGGSVGGAIFAAALAVLLA